jgi:hypothetical protein
MRRISPALVVSVVALVCALTGTAVASKYLITSTKQIKPSVRKALKGSAGSRGPAGQTGATGAQGMPGPPGMSNFKVVESAHIDLPPGGSTPSDWSAQCPTGTVAVGTGWYVSIADLGFAKAYGTFVGGIAFNNSGITVQDVHMQAMCATVSASAARTVASRQDAARNRFLADREAALKAR